MACCITKVRRMEGNLPITAEGTCESPHSAAHSGVLILRKWNKSKSGPCGGPGDPRVESGPAALDLSQKHTCTRSLSEAVHSDRASGRVVSTASTCLDHSTSVPLQPTLKTPSCGRTLLLNIANTVSLQTSTVWVGDLPPLTGTT